MASFFFGENMKKFSKRRTDAVKGLRRYRFLFPPKNKYCLVGLKRHPDNWQLVVLTLCRIYNCFHSTKNKCCSRETSEGRKKFYMKFFKYAAKEFRIDPRQLKTEHVEAYFHHKITERLNRGVEPKVIAKRIDNELSHLKFFAWWISKPNCIPKFSKIMKAETFRLENCPMSNFRSSHTDTSALRKKVNDAFKINDYLGVQVMAMAYFGLRPAESVSLEHQESFCSEGGRPFIHVLKGSKGGKPRKILMKTVDQHDAFEQLSSFCTEKGIELFRNPNLSVQEALRLQRKQLVEELGLSKEVFEGSAYSMRHSFASRMMDGYNPNGERSSLEVSEDLGHHRTEVTAVYVGNMERAGEDTIPGLLTALVSNPMHSSTEDRLKMFFRELLVSHTFLGFSLLFWCAYTHNEGRDLEALAARKQAILGKKRNLYTEEVLMEKLSSISTKSTAEQFLIQFNQCCPADWIEKNVMAPFDANLFFK